MNHLETATYLSSLYESCIEECQKVMDYKDDGQGYLRQYLIDAVWLSASLDAIEKLNLRESLGDEAVNAIYDILDADKEYNIFMFMLNIEDDDCYELLPVEEIRKRIKKAAETVIFEGECVFQRFTFIAKRLLDKKDMTTFEEFSQSSKGAIDVILELIGKGNYSLNPNDTIVHEEDGKNVVWFCVHIKEDVYRDVMGKISKWVAFEGLDKWIKFDVDADVQ